MKLRPEVEDFAKQMETKLLRKDHLYPNGWGASSEDSLVEKMYVKFDKFVETLPHEQSRKSAELAADVANYLMMIVDNLEKEKVNVYAI